MTSFLGYQPDKPITKTLDASSCPKKRIMFSCQNIQECNYIPIAPFSHDVTAPAIYASGEQISNLCII
jgi:hypothetical protein